MGQPFSGFIGKGYLLADKLLNENSNSLSNIGFILGTKFSFCIPTSEVLFGENSQSLYAKTPLGVAFKGDLDTLLHNLPTLPPYLPFNSYVGVCAKKDAIDIDELTVNVFQSTVVDSTDNDKYISVLDKDCCIVQEDLERALNSVLNDQFETIDVDHCFRDTYSNIDKRLVQFLIDKTDIREDGMLVMPLLWNPPVHHLLGKN